jgi:hypothetical protein
MTLKQQYPVDVALQQIKVYIYVCVHLIINDVHKYTNWKTKGYILYINQY